MSDYNLLPKREKRHIEIKHLAEDYIRKELLGKYEQDPKTYKMEVEFLNEADRNIDLNIAISFLREFDQEKLKEIELIVDKKFNKI